MSTFNSFFPTTSAPAITIPGGVSLTHADLRDRVAHLQTLFTASDSPLSRLGADPAARLAGQSAVAIAVPLGLEFAATFLAVVCHGKIAAPLNAAYTKAEFDFYLQDLVTEAVVVPQGATLANTAIIQSAHAAGAYTVEVYLRNLWVEADVFRGRERVYTTQTLQHAVRLDAGYPGTASPDSIALVLHTSGTTGRPKAVPLTHLNLLTTARNIADTYRLTGRDRGYVVMPLFHVHGLVCGLLAPLATGGSCVVPPKFLASVFWKQFVEYGCNWYTAVPTIHQILLQVEAPTPLPDIRFIRSCSSALSPSTLEALEAKFHAPVLEAYAMTEAAHQMCLNPLPPAAHRAGSVGLGQGVEVAILDMDKDEVLATGSIGEVAVRGANVTKGYLNNDKANKESFTASGFFRTGDQGRLDSQGYLTLTGRIKELINRGGEKISPIELDGVLLSHPAVAEAVAYAVENEKYGQIVHAAVVLHKGQSVSETELRQYVGTKVAGYKVPEVVHFVDELPKTATGKIQRRVVAQVMAQRAVRSAKL